MYSVKNLEKYYSASQTAMNSELFSVIRKTVCLNNPVGTLVGYYDENLTITMASEYFLYNLGYSLEEFERACNSSLSKILCDDIADDLREWEGVKEGRMLTSDGTPVAVRIIKSDSVDEHGVQVWVLAVHLAWEHENLLLINKAIHSAPWYIDFDKNGMIEKVYWSQTFRQMLGYKSKEEFPDVLESWSDAIHPEDKEATLECFFGAVHDKTGKEKYDVEYRFRLADGTYHWVHEVGEVIRRLDGSPSRVAGVFIDIEKVVNTRRKLKKAEAFHDAFTNTNLCEYYVDLQDNTYEPLKVAAGLQDIFDKSQTWDELTYNFSIDKVCEEYKDAVKRFYDRGRIAVGFANGEEQLGLECEIMLKGERRWVLNVMVPGKLEGIRYAMVFLRDITDIKLQNSKQQQLQKHNTDMEHLVNSMAQVVDRFAVCDFEQDIYEYHNINGVLRYPDKGKYSDLIKHVTQNFKTLEPFAPLAECLNPAYIRKHLLKEGDIYKFEYCSYEEDIFLVASLVPLEWRYGVLTKVLWIGIDTTEIKKNERESRRMLKDAFKAAERASAAKTEFLSNMSHDLRTPMNAIVGLTALAGANLDNVERVKDCLNKIAGSSRHLLGLINEVLDMARIESGRIALVDEDFNLQELVDNMVSMIKPSLVQHGHNFDVNVRHIEHEAVCGDSLRIQQMLINFLTNAIKYTNDGGKIRFDIEELPNGFSELGCFRFIIEDNGIGMSEEFQQVMFNPFTRADDKRTTQVPGTGLGMAIAQNIVKMMNGEIKVESKLNQGTRIMVTIYLKLQDKEYEKIKELAGLPVLVVDDDELCCENTVATLQGIGLKGEWVNSGEKAVQLAYARHDKKDDFFAIIMDWQMPGMDGIETTRKIRERIGSDVTIIMLTSYDYADIVDEAKEAGVDGFIEKPLFRSKLTSTLQRFIEHKEAEKPRDYLAELKATDYSQKRVLMVEDNQLNREIACSIIGMTKVQIETAENGKEAVDKLIQSPEGWFDLVFMDIQMPIMNGYEATAAIRALAGSRGKVPIVAVTANAFAEDVQLAKNAGMNGHLEKPLDFKKLSKTLTEWLG